MTDSRGAVPLAGLLHTLRLAGVDIDAEAALDSVWLALRIQERAAAAGAEGAAVETQPGPGTRRDVPPADSIRRESADTGSQRDISSNRTQQYAGAVTMNAGAPAAPARTLTLARAAALPESRALVGAMRPLRRRVPSPGAGVLDLDTTVRRAAEEDLWIPSFAPARERWLDVLLVADHGLSMIVWKDTIDEFERALRNAGAFRSVRSWWLESDRAELAIAPRGRAPRPATPQALTKLVRGQARSLVLVLTDCVGPRWHDGAVPRLMAEWSQKLPVALVQVTPEWFWARTALGDTVPSSFRSPIPATLNRRLRWDTAALGPVAVTKEVDATLLRMPAMTLTAGAVSRVAGLMAGKSREWAPGVVFDLSWEGDDESRQVSTAGAEERVARFRTLASKPAQRLAAAYSASPVRTLNVLRLLRRDLIPGASPFIEAEVLLGGLLRARKEGARWDLGEDLPLEFFPGVQPLLLDGVVAADVVRVLAHAARVAATGVGPTFTTWLDSPASGAAQLDPSESAFAASAAEVLSRLGGSYARLVKPAPISDGGSQAATDPVNAPTVEARESETGDGFSGWSPHQLPITAPLVGREVLVERVRHSLDGGSARPPLFLFGDEGIGKTAIAAHVIDAWRSRSGEEPFAWRFQQDPSTHETFQALRDRYADRSDRHGNIEEAVLDGLSQRAESLVVFDGIDGIESESERRSVIGTAMALARVPSARVLMTGRQLRDEARECEVLEIGPLGQGDFVKLIGGGNEETISVLSDLSAGNPLVALTLFEKVVAMTAPVLLEELAQSPDKRQVIAPGRLAETVDLLERAMRARELSATARDRRDRGDLDLALEALTEAVSLRGTLPSMRLRAEALRDRGQLNLLRADFERASSDLADAVGIFGMASAPGEQGKAQLLLSEARAATGRLEEARALLDDAMKNARMLQDERAMLLVLLGVGRIETQRGFLDEALASLREATAVAERLGDARALGIAHMDAALVLSQMQNWQQALGDARTAADLLRQVGDPALISAATEKVASIEQALGVIDSDRVQSVEYHVRGRVQGVGFRAFVQMSARDIGVEAEATNLADGRIHVRATGPRARLDQLETLLRKGPPQARVDGIDIKLPGDGNSTVQGNPPSPASESSSAQSSSPARRLNQSRAVIAIGVASLGSWPPLGGAEEAARRVCDWARSQGREATLMTGQSATMPAIFKAVRDVIDMGTTSQLTVYFAGYATSIRHDRLWLLSGAPEDPSAAVSVNECAELGRHAGIPHLVLISDSCQVSAEAVSAVHMVGGSVFPRLFSDAPSGAVDQFHATTVSGPAVDSPDVASESKRYVASYTNHLLYALSGAERSLLENRDGGRFIRPRELAKYLERTAEALDTPAGLRHRPESRIESETDAWLAAFEDTESDIAR